MRGSRRWGRRGRGWWRAGDGGRHENAHSVHQHAGRLASGRLHRGHDPGARSRRRALRPRAVPRVRSGRVRRRFRSPGAGGPGARTVLRGGSPGRVAGGDLPRGLRFSGAAGVSRGPRGFDAGGTVRRGAVLGGRRSTARSATPRSWSSSTVPPLRSRMWGPDSWPRAFPGWRMSIPRVRGRFWSLPRGTPAGRWPQHSTAGPGSRWGSSIRRAGSRGGRKSSSPPGAEMSAPSR